MIYTRSPEKVAEMKDRAIDNLDVTCVHRCQGVELLLGLRGPRP